MGKPITVTDIRNAAYSAVMPAAEAKAWVATLKPGNKVIIKKYGHSYQGAVLPVMQEVEKVTPSGQVVLKDGSRYNPDGKERGGNSRLLPYNAAVDTMLQEYRELKRLRGEIEARLPVLDLFTARQIIYVLNQK